jgi:hypothetical protein
VLESPAETTGPQAITPITHTSVARILAKLPRSARRVMLLGTMRAGLTLMLLALGCGGPWETVSYVDEGILCAEVRNGRLGVTVSAPECLSSNCSRDVEASCTATLDGATIEVRSEISWEDKHGPFARCNEDCGDATATCDAGLIADGNYTVVLGDARIPLTIPVPDEGSCTL